MATASPDLDELNEAYAGRWHVWRSVDRHGCHAAWVATNLDPDSDRAPTLHAGTLVELTKQMENPPRRHARPFSARGCTRDRRR